ncbi:MAG: single-stranded DNA-binding protein [Acidobacteria bacterium]|nr:single-stranded DNA-binding protein [Acidobacteriota bacterium]
MSAYAQIIGRLGQDPELNSTNGGTAVLNISVASNRQRKNSDGERISVADWFRVTVFGRDAEVIAQYARKGSALAFNGRLQTDSYTDRDGNQRTSTYLVADSFEFLPTAKRADENEPGNGETNDRVKEEAPDETSTAKTKRKAKSKVDDDSIPF